MDVHTDPDFPPTPPHATTDHMWAMTKSLAGGDPDSWTVLKTGIRQKAQEFVTTIKGH